MSSWLWFHRGQDIRVELTTGLVARYLGWRRAHVQISTWWWDGPALRLLVAGQVTHGWDPATVTRIWVHEPRCGDCKHWYDVDAERSCPRLRHMNTQAMAYIATGLKNKKPLETKVFEGTGIFSEKCSSFTPVSG